MNKTLFLFTASFPYSTIENFLQTEILYLSRYFDKVFVIPQTGTGEPRMLPDNCCLCQPIFDDGITSFYKKYKDFICIKSFPIVINEFFKGRVFFSRKKFVNWLKFSLQLNRLYNNPKIKRVKKIITPNDVCYFYWGVGSNLLSLLFKGKCHLVSRYHGEWDLWEEMYGGYVPYRSKVVSFLDRAVFISKKGKGYFDNRYPDCNTVCFPLGTIDRGISHKSDDGIVRIISCSSVYPLKRVNLICEVVNSLANNKLRVEWTHIGGGQDFEKLRKQVNLIDNPNLTIHLLGQVPSEEVISYYVGKHVDVFVNLSKNEGVPVSIMEAISCNIPIVATNVGATSEVVGEECGVLISPNPTIEEVVKAVLIVIKKNDEFKSRRYWKQYYDAEVNYNSFAKMLFDL